MKKTYIVFLGFIFFLTLWSVFSNNGLDTTTSTSTPLELAQIANVGESTTSTAFPAVTAFNVPSSLESGQIANIGWTIANGGGHSLLIFCAQGVKFINSLTNQVFPCDARTSISETASEGVPLTVANVSGGPRIVTVRIIPKDGGKKDYDAGAKEATIYVNPSREPVSVFYSTATTTISESPTKLVWVSKYLDGVNLKIACKEGITATSSTFGIPQVPCGQILFSKDLPGSGSVTFLFNNPSSSDVPLDVTLLPAISPGSYDGTRATTLTLTVASDAQKPITTSFSSSRNQIFSGDSILFNWIITNGSGANIKFQCSPGLALRHYSSATTTPLSCGDYAWKTPLGATGSTSVSFISSSLSDEEVTATIFPLLKNKTYDGAKTAVIKIFVAPVPKGSSVVSQSNVATSTMSTSTASTSLPSGKTVGKNVFTRWLGLGSKGADVKLLQVFLAKDKAIYPEGYTTGTFGVATRRAVGRFQLKNVLIKSESDPLYGILDAKTRALLNSLQ